MMPNSPAWQPKPSSASAKDVHSAGLNCGDCASYALAKKYNIPLLFKGSDFARTDIVPALPAPG